METTIETTIPLRAWMVLLAVSAAGWAAVLVAVAVAVARVLPVVAT